MGCLRSRTSPPNQEEVYPPFRVNGAERRREQVVPALELHAPLAILCVENWWDVRGTPTVYINMAKFIPVAVRASFTIRRVSMFFRLPIYITALFMLFVSQKRFVSHFPSLRLKIFAISMRERHWNGQHYRQTEHGPNGEGEVEHKAPRRGFAALPRIKHIFTNILDSHFVTAWQQQPWQSPRYPISSVVNL